MLTLGLETSCDETSAAVVRDGKVLSNVVVSSLKEHVEFGGVVPEIASRAQLEALLPVTDRAVKAAKVKLKEIDLIAVTQGPGLLGSLLVGLSAAKALALALGKPVVGVDHVLAHAYAGFLSDRSVRFPALALVISGGHTVILRLDSASKTRVLGRTIDDAAGEAFDKVAKMLGLGYPGGPEIDRLAKGTKTSPFHFTRPLLTSDSFDFSFSGIKTAVFYEILNLKKKKPLTAAIKKEICVAFQESVCDVLVKKTLRAAQAEGLDTIVVGGGVSANSRLRQRMAADAPKAGVRAVFPPLALCQDNAAMIAAYGAALYEDGRRDTLEMSSYPNFESRS